MYTLSFFALVTDQLYKKGNIIPANTNLKSAQKLVYIYLSWNSIFERQTNPAWLFVIFHFAFGCYVLNNNLYYFPVAVSGETLTCRTSSSIDEPTDEVCATDVTRCEVKTEVRNGGRYKSIPIIDYTRINVSHDFNEQNETPQPVE